MLGFIRYAMDVTMRRITLDNHEFGLLVKCIQNEIILNTKAKNTTTNQLMIKVYDNRVEELDRLRRHIIKEFHDV